MSDELKNRITAFVEEYYNCDRYKEVEIKEIKIDWKRKKIFIDVGENAGIVIGRGGKNIKEAERKVAEEFGKHWSMDIELHGKVPGSGQQGKGKEDKRSILRPHKTPPTVPFSSLKNDNIISELTRDLNEKGPILITLFRDSMDLSELKVLTQIKGTMNKRKTNFALQVMDKFPNQKVKILDWPNTFRSQYDSNRTSHAYISHCCRAAVIVYNEKHDISNEEPFKSALIQAVHDWTISDARDKWVVLGDETGTLDEFESKKPNNKDTSVMCWVVVPPGIQLPSLNREFHCVGNNGKIDYKTGIMNLSKQKDVLYYTFTYEEGSTQKSQNLLTKDPHLLFWQDTLPLVLEDIAIKNEGRKKVDIFVEQVGPLESGRELLSGQIAEFKTSLSNHRQQWNNLDFDQLWIVAKGEHPWIGYPDALGANVKRRFSNLKGKIQKIDLQIYETIIRSPYRQSSLNGSIRQLHKDTARPLVFLQSLSDISLNDQRDYVEVFLSHAITECLSKLNNADWERLLRHMMETSRTKQGQEATALIHQRTDIITTLDILKRPSTKFDFSLAMLGTSNHIGAKSQAELCQNIAFILMSEGYKPPKERLMKFENLLKGKADNFFDFSHIMSYELVEEMGQEEINFLGSQAQSRALRSHQNDRLEAQEIENHLYEHTENEDDKLRRIILRAELFMDQDDLGGALRTLTSEVTLELSEDLNKILKNDSYYMASFLKLCALSKQNISTLESLASSIPGLLNNRHPSQRIAYWTVRWIHSLGGDFNDLEQICMERLNQLKQVPLFAHDAPGVILACELLDLESKGYVIEGKAFFDIVKENSQPSTQAWLEQHPPNAEDWLAPLNFNYR